MLSGTIFYSTVEGWGIVDSLYFSVITLATVGYGDFAPRTTAGKLFTIFFIFVGIGLFVGVATAVARGYAAPKSERDAAEGDDGAGSLWQTLKFTQQRTLFAARETGRS